MEEYRGFIIKIKGCTTLVIEDIYGLKCYYYTLKYRDESKIIEEGRRVIDAAIEIINSSDVNVTNKIIKEAFSTIRDITVKENTPPPNPDGIARKAQLRKSYRNCMIQQGLLDMMFTLSAVFISLRVSNGNFYESLILWCICSMILIGDLMGIGTALAKKDFYGLGDKGEVMATMAAGINGKFASGYGGGLCTGPRVRYPAIIISFRIFLIIICGIMIYERDVQTIMYPALFLIVVHIFQLFRDIKMIRLVSAYRDLDDNGNSRKENRNRI